MNRNVLGALVILIWLLSIPAIAGAKGEARMIAFTCTSCHGPEGKSQGAIPSLQGLSRQKFLTALAAFRSSERQATIMPRIVAAYSEETLEAVVDVLSDHSRGTQ